MTQGLFRLLAPVNGATKCYFFDWQQTDGEVRDLLLEQLGSAGQQRTLDGSLEEISAEGVGGRGWRS